MRQTISYQSLHQYFAVLILSIISSGVTNAQDQQGSAFRSHPSLSIVVYQLQPSVAASFDIEIILTNLTDKAFDVDSIKIFLPESLKSIRDGFKEELSIQTHEISSGNEHSYRLGIPSVNTLYKSVFDMETLFLLQAHILSRQKQS